MPIKCPKGKDGFSCEGCNNLSEGVYCEIGGTKPHFKISIYEILTENERICALEERVDYIMKTWNEAPLPPPYQELLNRVEQTQGLAEHLHQHYHTNKKRINIKDNSNIIEKITLDVAE